MASGILSLPPELLYRILELAVDGLPASLRMRSSILRTCALVHPVLREPAQVLLESKVQIDSYQRARAFMTRPRRLERPLVIMELILYYDFNPADDELFPLTEFMTRSLCEMDCTIRSLHLRSALFANAFDAKLLLLPSFRELEHLKLDLPLDPPVDVATIPVRLKKLSLSTMMDQPRSFFRTILPTSADTLTCLHLFVIKSGSPLHEHVVETLPSITSNLRHLSLSTHWIPLSESLLRFTTSCTSLASLALSGVDISQVLYLISALSSRLTTLDFSIPSSSTWTDDHAQSSFEQLLRFPSLESAREISITQRLESGAERARGPSKVVERRGRRGCLCTWERTTRRPLP
ncbi:hypothetical protein JCM1840_007137 [Sporobolomyces johnsonii]